MASKKPLSQVRIERNLVETDAAFRVASEEPPAADRRMLRSLAETTTNQIEGSINAGLREPLHRHREMPEHHQCRAIEWCLHGHAITAPPPADLIKAHLTRPPSPPTAPWRNRSDQPATTPDSAPKKVYGPAEDGQDAHDTPGHRHTF